MQQLELCYNNISYIRRLSPDVGDLKEYFDITHESTQVCLCFMFIYLM